MRTWRTLVMLLLIGALCASGKTSRAEGDLADLEQQAMRSAVDKVAPSVVRITTVGGRESSAELKSVDVTGLIVSPDGEIITAAYNLAHQPTTILVTLHDGTRLPAKRIATDHSRSVVLLKVTQKEGASPLVVAKAVPAAEMQVGAWTIAVGKTFDEKEPNVSIGIVSAVGRVWGRAVQTDAKISPSNYGGPLIDLEGRVFGVLAPLSPFATAVTAGTEWYDSGVGFAVPLTKIQQALPKLREGQDLYRGLMGVSIQGRNLFTPAILAAVQPRGPAREAGLKQGDQIVAINGNPVEIHAQFKRQLGPLYAGETIKVAVLRDKKRVETQLQLVEKLIPYEHPFLGILPLRQVTPEEAKGVVIRYVYPDSPAEKAGIQVGDRITQFNGKPIEDSTTLSGLMNDLVPEEKGQVELVRDAEKVSLEVTLASLPETLPGDLPEAHPAPAASEGEQPKTGAFDIKLAEFKNECLAYVPENYNAAVPHGVVIWLQSPGKFDRKQLLARWKTLCQERNLILLAPRSRDKEHWSSDEVEFIRRVYDTLEKGYTVDPARVVAHGFEGGGAMAYLVAFLQRDLIRAVAAVDSPMPSKLGVLPTDPANRLALYVASSSGTSKMRRIARQFKSIRELKYPLVEVSLGRKSRNLNAAERSDLVNWIDSLDRI